jgi:hypothetical protein
MRPRAGSGQLVGCIGLRELRSIGWFTSSGARWIECPGSSTRNRGTLWSSARVIICLALVTVFMTLARRVPKNPKHRTSRLVRFS